MMKYIVLACMLFWSFFSYSNKLYQNRNHKLQLDIKTSTTKPADDILVKIPINFIYTQNFGYLETGLFLDSTIRIGKSQSYDIIWGFIVQWNIQKNIRNQNIVSSLGMKLGHWQQGKHQAALFPYLSIESFLSNRLSVNVKLEYPFVVHPWPEDVKSYFKSVDLRMGFAYYFP